MHHWIRPGYSQLPGKVVAQTRLCDIIYNTKKPNKNKLTLVQVVFYAIQPGNGLDLFFNNSSQDPHGPTNNYNQNKSTVQQSCKLMPTSEQKTPKIVSRHKLMHVHMNSSRLILTKSNWWHFKWSQFLDQNDSHVYRYYVTMRAILSY